jgi:hypothetical protein
MVYFTNQNKVNDEVERFWLITFLLTIIILVYVIIILAGITSLSVFYRGPKR